MSYLELSNQFFGKKYEHEGKSSAVFNSENSFIFGTSDTVASIFDPYRIDDEVECSDEALLSASRCAWTLLLPKKNSWSK
jgi:hypothetical protein